MKKNTLLILFILLIGYQGYSQNVTGPFFEKVDFIGAMGTTDWTKGWANFRPDTIDYPSTNWIELTNDITQNTTFTSDKVYHTKKNIHVRRGVTLTIQPGTVIRMGKNSTIESGAFIIQRGAKIIAEGTVDKPIVFTSDQPLGSRFQGDHGGLMIFGMAKQNVPGNNNPNFNETNFEIYAASDTTIWYGGNDDMDNSGVLKYVRIEFGGWYAVVDKEINGYTFGAVGAGTTVDYVQASFTNDDSFEYFGGTVNCKHMIAYAGVDDDFDTDAGYRGKIQFGLGLRYMLLSDQSANGASNGFESDDNTDNKTVAGVPSPKPTTAPIFSNITLVGPIRSGQTNNDVKKVTNSKFSDGMRIRTNSSLSVFNSVEMGFPRGLNIANSSATATPSTYSKAVSDSISIRHVFYANNDAKTAPESSLPAGVYWPANSQTPFTTLAFVSDTTFKNQFIDDLNSLKLIYPVVDTFDLAGGSMQVFKTPDLRPLQDSPLLAGADFTHPKLAQNLVAGVNDASETNLSLTAMPNPFSESTTITYGLANASNVNVTVYDLKGNMVAEIANGMMPAGQVSVNFNGSTLAKGIYVAKAVTGGTVKTVKLVIK